MDRLTRWAENAPWTRLPHPVRWIVVAGIGFALVAAGIAMLVLPGPGLLFIALGLLVLATEFAWAEALLHRVRHHTDRATTAVRSRIASRSSNAG